MAEETERIQAKITKITRRRNQVETRSDSWENIELIKNR